MTATVNRADLAWLLGATIPHAAKIPSRQLDRVGLTTRGSELFAYATDGYTVGVARSVVLERSVTGSGLNLSLSAKPSIGSKAEANDLLRYVKPGLKAEREQWVTLLERGQELHVGLADDSAVFTTFPEGLDYHGARAMISQLNKLPDDRGDMLYDPELAERFSPAKRVAGDHMTLLPKRSDGKVHGIMVVTIGRDFIGAVCGMGADSSINPDQVIASFLGDLQNAEIGAAA